MCQALVDELEKSGHVVMSSRVCRFPGKFVDKKPFECFRSVVGVSRHQVWVYRAIIQVI